MDIFEYAKECGTDYMEPSTGNIYKVQDYLYAKKNGLPTEGIDVYCDGIKIGIVREPKEGIKL